MNRQEFVAHLRRYIGSNVPSIFFTSPLLLSSVWWHVTLKKMKHTCNPIAKIDLVWYPIFVLKQEKQWVLKRGINVQRSNKVRSSIKPKGNQPFFTIKVVFLIHYFIASKFAAFFECNHPCMFNNRGTGKLYDACAIIYKN